MTKSQFTTLITTIFVAAYLHGAWVTGSTNARWFLFGAGMLWGVASWLTPSDKPKWATREDVRR